MKTTLKVIIVATCFMFTGCGIVQLSLRPHEYNATNNESLTAANTNQNNSFEECQCVEKYVQCEECKIQPVSGSMRDARRGYYYDTKTKKCKGIVYSSGGTPPPFQSMKECMSCCCKNQTGF